MLLEALDQEGSENAVHIILLSLGFDVLSPFFNSAPKLTKIYSRVKGKKYIFSEFFRKIYHPGCSPGSSPGQAHDVAVPALVFFCKNW